MASATTATMAAAGFDKCVSTASSLQTPGSGTFPSELRSPMASSPGLMKTRDGDLKTPITPPSAYLDFLKSMSPAMMSLAPTTGTSARFSFQDRSSEACSDRPSVMPAEKPSITPPTSQPALSRNTSYDSNTSSATGSSISTNSSSTSGSTSARVRPESPRVTIPPSPFAKPAPRSARTPRRLHIPQSPFSPAVPGSAHSISSPYVSTPLSSAPWSASFESKDANPEASGQPGRVSVRQVVTRTYTYCRTPLESAPNGNLWKRRKIEADEGVSKVIEEAASPPKALEKVSTLDPPIKKEKQENVASIPSASQCSLDPSISITTTDA
ncbi:hypothetical protein B0A50_04896 [Salinomyces thailandicus]|uniref:Uncharacterized protein n=1 Tax=Salinomyces thailandicus TaxID=706561 RepID=A0A4U0U124_9PEZI|nr:hypothetical protein B0A50_04896 [Salinomyces thailandica]